MISPLARKCIDLINGISECFPHRRPAYLDAEGLEQVINDLYSHVIYLDGKGSTELLELLRLGLKDQWDCFTGEQAVVDMGLTTFAHLEA